MDNTQPTQPQQPEQAASPAMQPVTTTAPQQSMEKLIDIQLTPGGTFLTLLVTSLLTYVPIVGAAFSMNYALSWVADNSTVAGRKVKFTATFGETFKFILVNFLLIMITFGIFIFWYIPRQYRYVSEHIEYVS